MNLLVSGLVMILISIYVWFKIPTNSHERYINAAKNEQYLIANVIESLGIFKWQERTTPENYGDIKEHYYYNKLKIAYYDKLSEKDYEDIIEAPCTFADKGLNQGSKITISKDKKGYLRYISDGVMLDSEIIDRRTGGEVFVIRFFLCFLALAGVVFLITGVTSLFNL